MINMYKIPVNKKPLEFLKNQLVDIDNLRTVLVVPTNRNLDKLTSLTTWQLDIQTISEFNTHINLYNGVLLPKELRGYYLYQAAKELPQEEQIRLMRNNASQLMENYISFVQRSSDLLPFYRELRAELINIEQLTQASCYQDYEEQMLILGKLWDMYLNQIHSMEYIDEWESYTLVNLDQTYLNRYDRYVFLIGGYLNNFELRQLATIAATKEVYIYFNYTGDVHPQSEKFVAILDSNINTFENNIPLSWQLYGYSAQSDASHTLYVDYLNMTKSDASFDLNNNSSDTHLKIIPCASQLAQFDLIVRRICRAHWEDKIDLTDIAVVLPDPRMSDLFIYSDAYHLFNVSAGRKLADYPFFELVGHIIKTVRNIHQQQLQIADVECLLAHPLLQNTTSNILFKIIDKYKSQGKLRIKIDVVKNSNHQGFQTIYKLISPFLSEYTTYSILLGQISTLFSTLIIDSDNAAVVKAMEGISKMQLLYSGIIDELKTVDLLQTITNELAQEHISVSKGKVAVIGLLESRNMDYKLIFVPDMNSDIFPATQNKDLFMNSELRRDLGLPTFSDRQELQKGYMYQIFARANDVYMLYTHSDETQPSIFINEILNKAGYMAPAGKKNHQNTVYKPDHYLIFPKNTSKSQSFTPEIIKTPQIIQILKKYHYSASSINMIKRCELQFFYSYIKGIQPKIEQITEAGAKEIGIILHNVLEELFKQGNKATDTNYLDEMCKLFDKHTSTLDYFTDNWIGIYEAKAIKALFGEIVDAEKAQLATGSVIQSFEEKKSMEFHGITINGRIDRWDITPNGYAIIDYKYKDANSLKIENSFDKLDVQLPLYALIMQKERGSYPSEILWFPLKKTPGFITAYEPENLKKFEDELLAFFNQWFTEGIPFSATTDEKNCIYCSYTAFCPGIYHE